MKNIIIALTLAITACNQSTQVAKDTPGPVSDTAVVKTAKIRFEHLTYDFGVITPGEKVTHTFKFRNTGDLPLVITGAQASCGCTVPEIPKDSVNTGEEASLKVVFNSFGKSGKQEAVITITSNGEPETIKLYLTGDIQVSR